MYLVEKLVKTFLPANELVDILFQYDQPEHCSEHYPFMVDFDGHLLWRARSGTAVVNCIRQLRRKRLISWYVLFLFLLFMSECLLACSCMYVCIVFCKP